MGTEPLGRLREICLALPDAAEKREGRPVFQVRGKTFAMFMDDHHGDGRVALWCKAPPGLQELLLDTGRAQFFRPPYVGHKGWIGVCLDGATEPVNWDEVADLVMESYRMTAPKRLLAEVAR